MSNLELYNSDDCICNVLVVDDHGANLVAIETALKPLSVNIFKAESADEALGHMLHNDFAVAVLDVQMPIVDGFELASLMRESNQTKHIPIIFATAISKEEKYVFKGYCRLFIQTNRATNSALKNSRILFASQAKTIN